MGTQQCDLNTTHDPNGARSLLATVYAASLERELQSFKNQKQCSSIAAAPVRGDEVRRFMAEKLKFHLLKFHLLYTRSLLHHNRLLYRLQVLSSSITLPTVRLCCLDVVERRRRRHCQHTFPRVEVRVRVPAIIRKTYQLHLHLANSHRSTSG